MNRANLEEGIEKVRAKVANMQASSSVVDASASMINKRANQDEGVENVKSREANMLASSRVEGASASMSNKRANLEEGIEKVRAKVANMQASSSVVDASASMINKRANQDEGVENVKSREANMLASSRVEGASASMSNKRANLEEGIEKVRAKGANMQASGDNNMDTGSQPIKRPEKKISQLLSSAAPKIIDINDDEISDKQNTVSFDISSNITEEILSSSKPDEKSICRDQEIQKLPELDVSKNNLDVVCHRIQVDFYEVEKEEKLNTPILSQDQFDSLLSDTNVKEVIVSVDEESDKIKTQEINVVDANINQVSVAAVERFEEINDDISINKIDQMVFDNMEQNLLAIIKARETKDIINAKKVESLSLFKFDLDKLKCSTQIEKDTVEIKTKSIPFRDSTKDQLLPPITVFKNAIKTRKFENSTFYKYYETFSKRLQSFKLLTDRKEVRDYVKNLNINLEKMKKIYVSLLEYENNKDVQNYDSKEEIQTFMKSVSQIKLIKIYFQFNFLYSLLFLDF
jgi:hypothetical protein